MQNRTIIFIRRCRLFLSSPREGAAEVLSSHAFLGGTFINWLVAIAGVRWVGEALWPAWHSIWGYLAVAAIAALLVVAIGTTSIHLLARLLRGNGSWTAMLALGGYAAVPLCLFSLLIGVGAVVWVNLFGPIPVHLVPFLFFVIATIGIFIVGLILLYGAVSVNYALPRGPAWVVTLTAVLLLSVTNSLMQRPYVKSCRIGLSNWQAMSGLPIFLHAVSAYDAEHFQLDVSANRAYLRAVAIQRGDLMLFESPVGQSRLARVLALPGEVAELKRGALFVNGKELPEPWRMAGDVNAGPYTLADYEYFLWIDDRQANHQADDGPRGVVHRQRLIGPPMFLTNRLLCSLLPSN